jgi:NADH:ubiquinone oxidoreductase subunit E
MHLAKYGYRAVTVFVSVCDSMKTILCGSAEQILQMLKKKTEIELREYISELDFSIFLNQLSVKY